MKTKTVKFLPPTEIDQYASNALASYAARYGTDLPFNAERLLETEFNVQVIPIQGLRALWGECSLARDGTTIYVDKVAYENEAMANRMLFTFAHELGHRVLHLNYLQHAHELSDEAFASAEKQADMFAARFLMPESILVGVVASMIAERLDGIVETGLTIDQCISYNVENLASHFGVSKSAMEYRIKNIDFNKHLRTGPYISAADRLRLNQVASAVERFDKNHWRVGKNVLVDEI